MILCFGKHPKLGRSGAEQPQPEQPGRSQPGMVRQNETQRANDVGRDLPENFALDQRLADQPELVIFEIAQPAMHQLGRPGRRPAGKSFISQRKTVFPRPAASRAMPQPLMPPPMMARSNTLSNERFPGDRLFTSAISLSVLNRSQTKTKASENGNWTSCFGMSSVVCHRRRLPGSTCA